MGNEKNSGWLGFIGDYTTQLFLLGIIKKKHYENIRIAMKEPGLDGHNYGFSSWLKLTWETPGGKLETGSQKKTHLPNVVFLSFTRT